MPDRGSRRSLVGRAIGGMLVGVAVLGVVALVIGLVAAAVTARAASVAAGSMKAGSTRAGSARAGSARAGSARAGSVRPWSVRAETAARPLAGKIIGIDPGHNGRNYTDPAFINHLIWNGREWEACDTTGTQTNGGYTESRFAFNVATYLAADLRKLGARVVLTRTNNRGVGPCVNTRAFTLDHARASVSIDIHADGGPSWGRGFTILEPGYVDKYNRRVIGSSLRFARDVHLAFVRHTPIRISDYYGNNGYILRNDLAGLNLTTMPKVLIECGNMRNRADARQLTPPSVQRAIAVALTDAVIRFLSGR